jgi:hypothetical protein
MRVPSGVVGEKGDVEGGHRGGRGIRGDEQILKKILWPTSSLVLTVNLQERERNIWLIDFV